MISLIAVRDPEENIQTLKKSLKNCTPKRGEVEFALAISCHDQATISSDRTTIMSRFSPSIRQIHDGTVGRDWRFTPTTPILPTPQHILEITEDFIKSIGKRNLIYPTVIVPDQTDYYCYVWESDHFVRLCYHEVVIESSAGLVLHTSVRNLDAHVRLVARYWADNEGVALT